MKAPDWSEWNYIPEVEVWQAVALSMNLEPNALRRNTDTPLLGFGSFFKEGTFLNIPMESEFDKRIRLVLANLVEEKVFSKVVINRIELRQSKLNLSEFVNWILKDKIFKNIPKKLRIIAIKSRNLVDKNKSQNCEEVIKKDKKTEGQNVKWTSERVEALQIEHNKLKLKNYRAPTKALAEKYGISCTRIRTLLRKNK
jgi:hypothetical protein